MLTDDLRGCQADGLIVAAPDVVLDLGGHSIAGGGLGAGIRVIGADHAIVKHGNVRGFATGILTFSPHVSLTTLDVSSNGTGVQLCCGFSGLEQSTVHDNAGAGVYMSSPDLTVEDNQILHNGVGIDTAFGADGSLIDGNTVMGNAGAGIHLLSSVAAVLGNTISRNGADGLLIQEQACGGFINLYRVGSNSADGNGRLGIDVPTPAPCNEPFDQLDAGGNAAKLNGDPQQCTIAVACAQNRGQANKLVPASERGRGRRSG